MSQDTAVKNLVESIESRFCLNSTADEVLDVVGEKTAVERPFVARVLAAVTEAITSRGETVTYPTLLSGMIATLETKDAIDKEQVILCDCVPGIADDEVCGRSVRHCVTV